MSIPSNNPMHFTDVSLMLNDTFEKLLFFKFILANKLTNLCTRMMFTYYLVPVHIRSE